MPEDLLSSEGELELWGRAAFRYLNDAKEAFPVIILEHLES